MTDQLNHATSYTYDAYKRIYTATTPVRGNGDNTVNTTHYNYAPWNGSSAAAYTANFPTIVTSPAGTVIWNYPDNNFRKIQVTQGA